MIAIEGFILEHWQELEHLQDKRDYGNVSEQFIIRVSRQADKNKTKLMKYVNDRHDLLELVKKGRGHELDPAEKETLRSALIAMLKTIPTFGIVPLPETFLTLPVLLKILPRNLFAEGIK
jgi:hypothetical protein